MATNKYLNLQGLTEVADKVNEKLKTVTTMPASPNINDVVLYKGTNSNYKAGSVYIYTTKETYYGWTDSTNIYYTKSQTPSIGDIVYSDTAGVESGYRVEEYNSMDNQVTINSTIFNRNIASDTPVYDWLCRCGVTPEVVNSTLFFDLDDNN